MRTFEALLIVVNVLSFVLSMKKQSKAVWPGVAGANLSVLCIHAIIEGFRYQTAFAYMLTLLFAIFALAKTKEKFEGKTPKALKVITISLSLVLLGFTSLIAVAFPVFTLPTPAGNHDVGVQYLYLIDESRTEPFLEGTTKNRELMVKIYYPAHGDASKPRSSYFYSPPLIHSFASFYGMPGFLFDHLRLVKTHAKADLQVSNAEESYPVILFSHGAGTSMEVQTSQSEDLASHGYIVVAIDHTYVSAATAFPDLIVSHRAATAAFNTPEPAEIITQIMADDSSFVMDTLTEINEGKIESIFKGKFDLENIGAMGHSVGGAVAYDLAIHDSRVKAAIDLDGVVYITPAEATDIAPFLMLANDNYHIQAILSRTPLMKRYEEMDDVEQKITMEIYGSEEAYREAYNKAQQNMIGLTEVLKSSGNLFTIEGSDHMKFTDIGLFIGVGPLRELIGIGGEIDPAKCLEITKSVTVVFFDRHLKGETSDSLESLVQKHPELINVALQ